MASSRVPDHIADRMVSLLFEETTTTFNERILYPGCGEGELISAVKRYFESNVGDPPEGVAIDTDQDCLKTVRKRHGDDVKVREADYLSADTQIDPFDYIISYPPIVEWRDLSNEKQIEYASSFAQISSDSTDIHTGLLFLERSLHVLTDDGSGVFLISSDFKTDATKGPFRNYLIPNISDIERVSDDSFQPSQPYMHLKINSLDSPAFDSSVSSLRPDPSHVEAELLTSASPKPTSQHAQRLATCHPELEVYSSSDDAAYIYLDLYYQDYDAALVYDSPEQLDGLCGYLSRATMQFQDQEPVTDHVNPLTNEDCINSEAKIGTIINRLGSDGERFYFVGTPSDPAGIVTRFDLNKMPVYQYLYVLLARFEIRMRKIIRDHAPDWKKETNVIVPSGNVGELSPDELAGTTIGNLIEILRETDGRELVCPELEAYKADLQDLRDLRNAIAHYNPLVHYMSNDVDSKWTAGKLRHRHILLQNIIDL